MVIYGVAGAGTAVRRNIVFILSLFLAIAPLAEEQGVSALEKVRKAMSEMRNLGAAPLGGREVSDKIQTQFSNISVADLLSAAREVAQEVQAKESVRTLPEDQRQMAVLFGIGEILGYSPAIQ